MDPEEIIVSILLFLNKNLLPTNNISLDCKCFEERETLPVHLNTKQQEKFPHASLGWSFGNKQVSKSTDRKGKKQEK